MVIEGTYLVPAGSPLRTIEDVDRDGVRVAVGDKSAYDLYLSRTRKRAQIVRAPTSPAAIDLFVAAGLARSGQADATVAPAMPRR